MKKIIGLIVLFFSVSILFAIPMTPYTESSSTVTWSQTTRFSGDIKVYPSTPSALNSLRIYGSDGSLRTIGKIGISSSTTMSPQYSIDVNTGTFRVKYDDNQYMVYEGANTKLRLYGGGNYTDIQGANASIYGISNPNLTINSGDPQNNPGYLHIQGFGMRSRGSGQSSGLEFNCDLLPNGSHSLGSYSLGIWNEIRGTTLRPSGSIRLSKYEDGSDNDSSVGSISQFGNAYTPQGIVIRVRGDSVAPNPPIDYSGYGYLQLSSTGTILSNQHGEIEISTNAITISTHTKITGNLTVTGTYVGTISTANYSLNSGQLGGKTSDYFAIQTDLYATQLATGANRTSITALEVSTGAIKIIQDVSGNQLANYYEWISTASWTVPSASTLYILPIGVAEIKNVVIDPYSVGISSFSKEIYTSSFSVINNDYYNDIKFDWQCLGIK